jgi:fibronectin type 3 domain-containing protein
MARLELTCVCALLLVASGCGIPAQPQPPSLDLAQPVQNLSAARTGNTVALHWNVPAQNTDKTPIKKRLTSEICRREQSDGDCKTVGSVAVSAGEDEGFQDVLPPELAAASPRPVFYTVQLRNARGRSAGESNVADALAGSAPAALTNLTAENLPSGIHLSWQSSAPAADQTGGNAKIVDRITRTTLSSEANAPTKSSVPAEHTLEVPASDASAALDTTRTWGDTYRYQVQAVAEVKVDAGGKERTLEMAGLASPPVQVAAKQIFPPAAPQGLAVVPVWGSDGKPAMDLHWEPNTEPELAGYQVYRVQKYAHRALESRKMASGDKLLTVPAFRDHDLIPGTVYRYSVVAVDTKGNTSAESAAVPETARTGPE